MTLIKLASEIAKREGKKTQARIGDIREILKIISTLNAESVLSGFDGEPLTALHVASVKIVDKLSKKFKK